MNKDDKAVARRLYDEYAEALNDKLAADRRLETTIEELQGLGVNVDSPPDWIL